MVTDSTGAHSPLEGYWRDNVKREKKLLAEHPEWKIKRLKPEGAPQTAPTTYEATDGVITLTSEDLGRVIDLIYRAMQGGD